MINRLRSWLATRLAPMTAARLKFQHADLCAEIQREAFARGLEVGAAIERERIRGVIGLSFTARHLEPLLDRFAFDGVTQPEAAALAFNIAQTAEREARASAEQTASRARLAAAEADVAIVIEAQRSAEAAARH